MEWEKTAMKGSRLFVSSLAAALLLLPACDSGQPSEKTEVEHNVIKDYVNVPKQKARDARDKVESAQQKAREQIEGLDE